MRSWRRAAVTHSRHERSRDDACNGRPLIEPKARKDRGLRFTAPSLFHKAPQASENEVDSGNEMQGCMQDPQARYGRGNKTVPQDRVYGRGMERQTSPSRQSTNTRARVSVANPQRVGREPSVTATLHKAAQPAHGLGPRSTGGERSENEPRARTEQRCHEGAEGPAEQATVETKRAQKLGRSFDVLGPQCRPNHSSERSNEDRSLVSTTDE